MIQIEKKALFLIQVTVFKEFELYIACFAVLVLLNPF